MMLTDLKTTVVTAPAEQAFSYQAALYFLDAGHYLFQDRTAGMVRSKFVTIRDVQAAFTQHEEDTGWLPAGIVRCGSNSGGSWYVYSAPAQKVTLQIVGKGEYTIPIPRTVLMAAGGNYYLWALTAKTFEHGAPAYHAPFPNVHDSGLVCWGANQPPAADAQKARKAWELFFGSPFNNHLANDKSRQFRADVAGRYAQMAEAKAKAYPADDLFEERSSIGSLIESKLSMRR